MLSGMHQHHTLPWLILWLGFVGGSLLLIDRPRRKDLRPLLWCGVALAAGGVFSFVLVNKAPSHAIAALCGSAAVFCACFIGCFWKRVTPVMDERTLLICAILFLYLLFRGELPLFHPGAAVLLLIPCAMVLAMSFTAWRPSEGAMFGLYVWLLVILGLIAWRQFQPDVLSPVGKDLSAGFVLSLLFAGMAAARIAVLGFTVLQLVSGSRKEASEEEMERDWKHKKRFLLGHCSTRQLSLTETLAIDVLLGGGLALNTVFPVVSDNLLINGTLALLPFLLAMPISGRRRSR